MKAPLLSQVWRFETERRDDGAIIFHRYIDDEWYQTDTFMPKGGKYMIWSHIYKTILDLCGIHSVASGTADAYTKES